MASAKQLAANRANSQKSTGPVTEAGKNISRRNAVQHGLSGQSILVTPEQDSALQTYSGRLMPDLAPANAVELTFAERIIFDSWRLSRAAVIEQNLFALADPAFDTGDQTKDDALNDANTYQLNDRSINLLSLYQQRLQRAIHKDLAMLRQMQKERKAAAAKPVAQVIDFPVPQPIIGSVCPPPLSASSPPPAALINDLENLAA